MDITTHRFPISDDLADKVIGLSTSFEGIQCHNKGGWQGNISEEYPAWATDLVKSIEDKFANYTIQSAWFNVNGPGHSNRMHSHYVNSTTGVLYIKVPENSGRVVFQHNREIVHITPVPGRILTFPADLMHMVEENKSQDFRVSLAFNLIQR